MNCVNNIKNWFFVIVEFGYKECFSKNKCILKKDPLYPTKICCLSFIRVAVVVDSTTVDYIFFYIKIL